MLFQRSIFNSFKRSFHTTNALLSAQSIIKRKTIKDIYDLYKKNEKISVLTAYDYISGKMANDAGTDIVLVGDSLAMVALGYEDTNELPFDEFLYHCRATARGVNESFLVADLPFGSYESSISKAIESSIQLISKGRVNAVKLEGGVEIAPTVKALTSNGIPVIAHVGLTPQRFNALGGFKVQGKTVNSAFTILEDALTLQEAGAFAVLIEAVPSPLGKFLTEKLDVPTIGIGAGSGTSGQVLVQADMLGNLNGHIPKFVKQYMNGYEKSVDAIKNYIDEVKSKSFPEEGKHTYKIKDEIFQQFLKEYEQRIQEKSRQNNNEK